MGQGTSWSPPNWSSISDLITQKMDKYTPGLKLVHPNRIATHQTVDSFVDDTNSGLTQDALDDFTSPPKHQSQETSNL